MAQHGAFTDALIGVGKYDLSGVSNECSVNLTVEPLDSTTFGNTSRRKLPGLLDGSWSAACVWDDATVEAALNDLPSDASDDEGAFVFAPSKTAGGPAYVGSGCVYTVERGGVVGELYSASFQANFRHAIAALKGVLSENGQTARTANGNGTGGQLGAVGATQYLYGALLVTVAAGGTIDVVVESDDNGAFSSAVTRITFPQVTTSAVSYFRRVQGAITDDHFRVRWTVGGGAPSYRLIAAIGIF